MHEKDGRNTRLSQFFGERPIFSPIFPCLFTLLSSKQITRNSFAVISALVNHGYFTLGGQRKFPMSVSQICEMVDLTDKPVRVCLSSLSKMNFITVTPARNGLQNWIQLNLENLQSGGRDTYGENPEEPTEKIRRTYGENPEDLRKNSAGTYGESTDHLLSRYLQSLSQYESRMDSVMRERFKVDMRRLLARGFDAAVLASFLDTEVYDFGKVGSFYRLITSKKDELQEIHLAVLENRKNRLEIDRVNRLRTQQDTTITHDSLSSDDINQRLGSMLRSSLN